MMVEKGKSQGQSRIQQPIDRRVFIDVIIIGVMIINIITGIIIGIIIVIVNSLAFVYQCHLITRLHLCVLVWKRMLFNALWPSVCNKILKNGGVIKWKNGSETLSKVEMTVKNRAFENKDVLVSCNLFFTHPVLIQNKCGAQTYGYVELGIVFDQACRDWQLSTSKTL